MTVDDLYSLAEEEQVGIFAYDFGDDIDALSVLHDDWTCDIALNMDRVDDAATEKTLLAHEMGHCMTGSFYTRCSPFDIKQRHENRADRWAITNVIPFDEMLNAMRSGCTERWQLAYHFNVTEDMIQKAYAYYTGPAGLSFCG